MGAIASNIRQIAEKEGGRSGNDEGSTGVCVILHDLTQELCFGAPLYVSIEMIPTTQNRAIGLLDLILGIQNTRLRGKADDRLTLDIESFITIGIEVSHDYPKGIVRSLLSKEGRIRRRLKNRKRIPCWKFGCRHTPLLQNPRHSRIHLPHMTRVGPDNGNALLCHASIKRLVKAHTLSRQSSTCLAITRTCVKAGINLFVSSVIIGVKLRFFGFNFSEKVVASFLARPLFVRTKEFRIIILRCRLDEPIRERASPISSRGEDSTPCAKLKNTTHPFGKSVSLEHRRQTSQTAQCSERVPRHPERWCRRAPLIQRDSLPCDGASTLKTGAAAL